MRVARKHISWYTKGLSGSAAFRHHMNSLESTELQLQAISDFFAELKNRSDRLVYDEQASKSTNNKNKDAIAA
jgi:tRNA-dihydrouridine synthase B